MKICVVFSCSGQEKIIQELKKNTTNGPEQCVCVWYTWQNNFRPVHMIYSNCIKESHCYLKNSKSNFICGSLIEIMYSYRSSIED